MKTISKCHFTTFSLFFLINILVAFPEILLSQNTEVSQTLVYINKKFQEFPYQNAHFVFYYTFNLTRRGELKIERKNYLKNPFIPDLTELAEWTIFKIGIDKIDLDESFHFQHFNEIKDIIHIYPEVNKSFYEEKIDYKGVQEYVKNVPYQGRNEFAGGLIRNSIIIHIGDAGKKDSIEKALIHLCSLVVSNPGKYGLNKESDSLGSINELLKSNKSSDNQINKVRIISADGNLVEVPTVLNDLLRINFVFDSKASGVSLSPEAALMFVRTYTVSENDWLPGQPYRFADGYVARSKRFIIKSLIIGTQVLTNIKACISPTLKVPVLIGQDVLEKLGSVTIDYDDLFLTIKTK